MHACGCRPCGLGDLLSGSLKVRTSTVLQEQCHGLISLYREEVGELKLREKLGAGDGI